MIFFMQNTRAGSHPLYIGRINYAAVASTVMVRYAAFIGNRNGFKTFMRVYIHTANMIRWTEIIFSIKIHHQKRTNPLLRKAVTREIVKYPKPISNHSRPKRAIIYFFYRFFHDYNFLLYKDNYAIKEW